METFKSLLRKSNLQHASKMVNPHSRTEARAQKHKSWSSRKSWTSRLMDISPRKRASWSAFVRTLNWINISACDSDQNDYEPGGEGNLSPTRRTTVEEFEDPAEQSEILGMRGHCQDYEVEYRIGEGAQGRVFKAIEKKGKQERAIKQIRICDPSDIKKASREVSSMYDLQHPNIVKIYNWFIYRDEKRDETYLNIVMEYCDGSDLNRKIIEARKDSQKRIDNEVRNCVFGINY